MTEEVWGPRSETFLKLADDGTWKRVEQVSTPVDPQPIFDEFVKTQGYMTPLLGPGTYTYFKGQHTVLIQLIEAMPFRAPMTLDTKALGQKSKKEPEVMYMPDFNGYGIKVEPAFVFVPPKTMRMIFITSISFKECYLVAQDTRTGQVWHPIMPNIHANGLICMGGAPWPQFQPKLGLDAFLQQHYKNWSDADFTYDLIGESGVRLMEFLRFSEKTKKNIIPKNEDWTAFSLGKLGPSSLISEVLIKIHEILGGDVVEKEKKAPAKKKKEAEVA